MKKYFLISLIIVIFIFGTYLIYSLCLVRTGVIVLGKEAVVFTSRKWSEIKTLDYNTNGKDWVWIGNNKKLPDVFKKISSCYNETPSCLYVKIRYINLFLPARATYVEKAKMPIVYVIDIKPIGECAACDDDINMRLKEEVRRGNIDSYNKLRNYYSYPADFLGWALYMANKYDYPQAYFDVFNCILYVYQGEIRSFDDIDPKTKKIALEYLTIAADKGIKDAQDILNRRYKAPDKHRM